MLSVQQSGFFKINRINRETIPFVIISDVGINKKFIKFFFWVKSIHTYIYKYNFREFFVKVRVTFKQLNKLKSYFYNMHLNSPDNGLLIRSDSLGNAVLKVLTI